MRSHRRQPTRLPRPWDSPGRSTGVGCHFLLQCMKVKSESEVAQSRPTLRDPMDCSPPGSSIHGIFQAGVLEWGAIAFSKNAGTTQLTKTRTSSGFAACPTGALYSVWGARPACHMHSVSISSRTPSTWDSPSTLCFPWPSQFEECWSHVW